MVNRFLRKQNLILFLIGAIIPQLALGSNPTLEDEYETDFRTAFQEAAEYLTMGHDEQFITFTKEQKNELLNNYETTSNGWNLIHFAVNSQNLEAFNQLVKIGYVKKYRGKKDNQGKTPYALALSLKEQLTDSEPLSIMVEYLNEKISAETLNKKTIEYVKTAAKLPKQKAAIQQAPSNPKPQPKIMKEPQAEQPDFATLAQKILDNTKESNKFVRDALMTPEGKKLAQVQTDENQRGLIYYAIESKNIEIFTFLVVTIGLNLSSLEDSKGHSPTDFLLKKRKLDERGGRQQIMLDYLNGELSKEQLQEKTESYLKK